jgi:hypothetical protein
LSEEESQHGDAPAAGYIYDETDEGEENEAAGQELMEVDGQWEYMCASPMGC